LHEGPSLLKLYHFALIVHRHGATKPITLKLSVPPPPPPPSPSPSTKANPPKRLLTRLPLRAYTIHKTHRHKQTYIYVQVTRKLVVYYKFLPLLGFSFRAKPREEEKRKRKRRFYRQPKTLALSPIVLILPSFHPPWRVSFLRPSLN
jgi:hypothetical protein